MTNVNGLSILTLIRADIDPSNIDIGRGVFLACSNGVSDTVT